MGDVDLMKPLGLTVTLLAVFALGLTLTVSGLVGRRAPQTVLGRTPAKVIVARHFSPTPIAEPHTAGAALPVPPAASFESTVPDPMDRFLAALDRGEDGPALAIFEREIDLTNGLDPSTLDRLIQACRGGHAASLRAALIHQIVSFAPDSLRGIAPEIIRSDPEPEARRAAIQAAVELRGQEVRGALRDAFADGDPAVRADAVSALACLKHEESGVFDRVAAALRAEPDPVARGQMAQALASLDDARAEPLIRELGLASAAEPARGPQTLIAD